ncbi:AMMECR1 domain-containing protein [Ditylenchus destructor]|uniref:AMMECR1 domain-containing protein n=1 Tax=Ditylenchus destructor TaxID=166010 RepID=A0AAD4QYN7_9BILA|nr:AMMECR1 domain-containing protein [Ditylenchus destructor]
MTIASIDMTVYCFDVVLGRLNTGSIPKCPPLFVTWKKGSSKHLRGCIGTFSRDLPLREGLSEYAQNSAFRDSRFEPVTAHEVPHLYCSVSLLVQFEPAQDYRDWIIGVHGIRIDYEQHGRRLSAVYLPEVAKEQGWSQTETLNHLMRKGGFQGSISENDRLNVMVERFQSEKISLSYEDYCHFKKQKGEEIAQPHSHRNGLFNSCRP